MFVVVQIESISCRLILGRHPLCLGKYFESRLSQAAMQACAMGRCENTFPEFNIDSLINTIQLS